MFLCVCIYGYAIKQKKFDWKRNKSVKGKLVDAVF